MSYSKVGGLITYRELYWLKAGLRCLYDRERDKFEVEGVLPGSSVTVWICKVCGGVARADDDELKHKENCSHKETLNGILNLLGMLEPKHFREGESSAVLGWTNYSEAEEEEG